VLLCLEQYEKTLGNRPKGKQFQEVLDAAKMSPTQDRSDVNEFVKQQLKEWGVPLRQ